MEDNEQVVEDQVSTQEVEQGSEEQGIAQPDEVQTDTQTSTQTVPEVRQPQAEDVDEMGVSYKNRFMESERKRLKLLEEQQERLNQNQQVKQEPETQKYTASQLKAFAVATEDPESREWALNELDRISREESLNIVRSELQNYTKKQQDEITKQRVFNEVVNRNPEIVIKDSVGNIVAFNDKSPLFARMNFYMNNKEISSRPDALNLAEALAMRDLAHAQKPIVAKTIEKQANQIKSLQKRTMVEGGGTNSNVSVSSRQAAIERQRQTGSMKDSANAMGAILRDSGLIAD